MTINIEEFNKKIQEIFKKQVFSGVAGIAKEKEKGIREKGIKEIIENKKSIPHENITDQERYAISIVKNIMKKIRVLRQQNKR